MNIARGERPKKMIKSTPVTKPSVNKLFEQSKEKKITKEFQVKSRPRVKKYKTPSTPKIYEVEL
jgi:hypothetical protein